MPHLAITTYNSGGPPGIDAAWLDALGAQVEFIYSTYMLATPYDLLVNGTLLNTNTNTYTISGITSGGVTIPNGITAAIINAYFIGSASGVYPSFTPHGTAFSNAKYPLIGPSQNSSVTIGGQAIVPVDGSGKIDVKANGGNCSNFYISVAGYIY